MSKVATRVALHTAMVFACTATSTVPVAAQEASGERRATGLEEITVTARRREESLQEAPISVTALTGDALRELGVTDLRGIANATPNMEFSYAGNGSGGGNFAQVFLRGVGQPDFIITKDPGVGIYVDGVYLARAPGSVLELLDVERIEVLRGPQGTLFGKNTIGGAVSVITKKPSGELGGVAEVTLGSFDRQDLSGSVEFPIVEGKLAARVSAMSRSSDGFYERLAYSEGNASEFGADIKNTEAGGIDRQSGRATFLFTPTESLEITLQGDVTKERQDPVEYQAVALTRPANIELYERVMGAGLAPYVSYVPPSEWQTYATWPGYNNSDIWGTALTIDWDVGAFSVKSITAYRDLDVQTKGDGDATPYNIVATGGVDISQHQFSEELQFSGTALSDKLNWVGGLWYFTETARDIQRSRQLAGLFNSLAALPLNSVRPGNSAPTFVCGVSPAGAPTCNGGGLANANDRAIARLSRTGQRLIENESYAVFLHATYAFTDAWSLTLGGRQSRETKDFTYSEIYPLLPVPYTDPSGNPLNGNPSFPPTTLSNEDDVFTPKVSLEFKPADGVLTYLQYSEGFKAGGFNGRPSPQTGLAPFDPEEIWTAEAGLKSDWLDNRLRVNAAVFYSEYSDIQITRLSPIFPAVRIEENAGDGEVKGAELEISAVPIDGLSLNAALGYLDFKYTSLDPGVVGITLDRTLPFSPELVAAVGAQYVFALGGSGDLSLRADYRYSDQYFIDPDNTVAIAQDAYDTFDARITYTTASGAADIFVGGTNLSDEPIVANGVNSPQNGSQIVTYKPPRQYYAGVRVNF